MDHHFRSAALLDISLEFFLDVLQRGLRVGGGLVFSMRFPDVPKDAVQIVMQDVGEKVALLHLPHLQRPHIEVVFSRRVFAQDGLPGSFQNKVHLVHTHIRNPVDEDFHIHHQPPEVGMRGKLAEQPVVDFAAA